MSTASALAPSLAYGAPSLGYEAPAVAYTGELAERNDAVLWVIFVGFTYAIALLYVAWCRKGGGSGEISLGWTGFKVVCRK
ncbi:MAG: hypothetical protein U0R50_00320 [Gaiellales bacterium]